MRARARVFRASASCGFALSFAVSSASVLSARTSGVLKRSTCERVAPAGEGVWASKGRAHDSKIEIRPLKFTFIFAYAKPVRNARILAKENDLGEHSEFRPASAV